MTKEKLTDAGWDGFIKAHEPDVLLKLAAHGKDKTQDEILRAIWRVGFYYALLCIEKGTIGIQDVSNN